MSGNIEQGNEFSPFTKKFKVTYFHYYVKSLKWFFGNMIFGLAPLLLMLMVESLTHGNTGGDEINNILHEGVIHFLGIALMGAVMTEYIISGIKFGGFPVFAIYIFPLIVLAFVSLEYLLVYLKKADSTCFDINSPYTFFVIFLSFLYCSFTKASFYIKEDTT
jgi:hypothetical protein